MSDTFEMPIEKLWKWFLKLFGVKPKQLPSPSSFVSGQLLPSKHPNHLFDLLVQMRQEATNPNLSTDQQLIIDGIITELLPFRFKEALTNTRTGFRLSREEINSHLELKTKIGEGEWHIIKLHTIKQLADQGISAKDHSDMIYCNCKDILKTIKDHAITTEPPTMNSVGIYR